MISSLRCMVMLVGVLVCAAIPAEGAIGFIGLRDGYFYDKETGEPWVPHGIAYQTWNRPVGVWQTHEQIDYDLDEMVKMGADSIRVDFVWQHIEEDGDNQWKWENYDYLVQAAEARGIRIFALIGYQWPPNWFPDEWYTQHPPEKDAEGIYHAERWQSDIINYEHPDARAQYAEWLATVAGRYKDSKAIAGWIIGNESGYLGLWSGLLDGYDPESEQAFRAWCLDKYGVIEAANTAWGSEFTSFDEIVLVEEYRVYGVEGAIWADMVQWREDSIALFTTIGAVSTKGADTNHLISYSTVGMQWGEEDWRYHAEDRGKITAVAAASGAPIDFFSVNNYPWSILGHESQNGQWGVSYTKKVAKVPVLYTETGFTSSESMWPGMNEFRQGPLVRNAMWESLAAGAIGTHIFSWMDRAYITDREKGFGILYADRRIKPAFWTSRDTFTLMDQVKLNELLMGSQDPTPDIAFLWTDANNSQHNRYECEMQQIAGALERLGYEPTFIGLDELADGRYLDYKVIILPRNMRVEDEVPGTGKTVLNFLRENAIAAGVHVLASADLPGLQDFHGKPRPGFEDEVEALFGIDASDIGGYEMPARTHDFVGSYWKLIEVDFNTNSPIDGYHCWPFVWKLNDRIKATDGEVWATMNTEWNRGFEDNAAAPAMWDGTWGDATVVDLGVAYDGQHALKLEGDAGIWKDFPVVPFGRYTHSAYLRANDDDPLTDREAFVSLEWYDRDQNLLGVVESAKLAGSTPQEGVPSPDPVAYWRMDEAAWSGSSYDVADSAGGDNNGRAYNGAKTTNQAMAVRGGFFDGANDYVSVPNTANLQIAGDLTLSFWIKPTHIGSGRRNPIDKSYGGEFSLTIEPSGQLSYYHGTYRQEGRYFAWVALPPGTLQNGTWYHLAIVRDTATRGVSVYLNGSLANATNYPAGASVQPAASTYEVCIGRGYAGYLGGYLDEVKIHNQALDAVQIQAEYLNPGVDSIRNSWVQYRVDAVAPSNSWTGRRIIRVGPPGAQNRPGPNLVYNGAMSGEWLAYAPLGWTSHNADQHDPDFAHYRDGNGSPNSWAFWHDGFIWQDIYDGFEPGDAIEIGGWLFTSGSDPLRNGSKYGAIVTEFRNSQEQLVSIQTNYTPAIDAASAQDEWIQVKTTTTVPEGTTFIRVLVRCFNYDDGEGRFNVEDVYVRKTTGGTASGSGAVYADDDPRAPALVVKDHGTAKSAIFLYSFGDNKPDGDLDNDPDVYCWKWRYDILKTVIRDGFGVQPAVKVTGTNAFLCLPEYRTLEDGSTLWQIKNYLYDTNYPASWTNLGGGRPLTFMIESDLLAGRTIEAFEAGRVIERNSDGKIALTLPPDGQEILHVYDSVEGLDGYTTGSSDRRVWRGGNDRCGFMPDGPTNFPLISQWSAFLGQFPVVAGERILGISGNGVYCHDARTGIRRWAVGLPQSLNPRSLAVADGIVLVTSKVNSGQIGYLFALDLYTGSLLWQFAMNSFNAIPPVVEDSLVYFGGVGDPVRAVDPESGEVVWQTSVGIGAGHYSGMALSDGKLYLVASTILKCVDASNGTLLWSRTIPRPWYAESTPAVADGKVYVAINHGSGVNVYDADTGAALWSYATASLDKFRGPCVADGKLFIAGASTLYCFDATNAGPALWTHALGGSAASSPVYSEGVVYLNADYFYALDANSGATLWSLDIGDNESDPYVRNGWVFFNNGSSLNAYSDGTPWSETAGSNQVCRIHDAPALVHPLGDKTYKVFVDYDCEGMEDLKLKIAFMEVGDNGDGTPDEIYQSQTENVFGRGRKMFWMWIPDANPGDPDYISSADGGHYQFTAWLETTNGTRVAEAVPQATQLKWGVRPTAPLPATIQKGGRIEVPIEWEDLYEYLSWENTPLTRNDAFPDRVAVFRSSKTEAQFPGQFDRVNEVADWLESLGYAAGNPLDISFDNVLLCAPNHVPVAEDDFADGVADGWSRTAGCARWDVEDGALRASRIGNSDNIMLIDSDPIGDCTVSADIRYNTQGPYFNDAELYVRYVDRDNFVKVGIRNYYGSWRLKYTVRAGCELKSQGWIHEFSKADRPLEGAWHNLKVMVTGTTYAVFFDEEEVGSFTDDHFAEGGVGLGSLAVQLGIWEPQKGYYFIDDDEYSFWEPEGRPQGEGRPLNLDWGYLDTFFPTLVLPGTYVMSDAEVSNVVVWLNRGLRSIIATGGGLAMKDETGAPDSGRIEALFGVANAVDTLPAAAGVTVGSVDHYIALDHAAGDRLATAGDTTLWPLTAGGQALGAVDNGSVSRPALIANVLADDPLVPKKVFCFNFDPDRTGGLTNEFRHLARRAFEWARGETYKVRLQLKYSINPTNQALDLALLTVDGWLLAGSGTSTLIVDIPRQGIMTGDNLYWAMCVYPWDAADPWLAHNGFYTVLNDSGGGFVSLDGKGLQIFGVTDYAYAGRDWDMWAGYNTRGSTCSVVFGIMDFGTLTEEDNFNDGDLAGWTALPEGNTQWSNTGDRVRGAAASGQALLVREGMEVGDKNITLSYDVYCNGGKPTEQGLVYRGYVLSIDTQGAWWQANTISNFEGIVTNADGSISYVITGGVRVFIGPAPLTTGKWQRVTVSIRAGEPTRTCDIYVDGMPYRVDMALPGTNYDNNVVGFVSPKSSGYVLVDNFRVADEQYSFVTQKVVGAFVPTNASQVTFWPSVPDYDPDWHEFCGTVHGGQYEWYAFLRGEGVEDRLGVEVYFAPRLMTERPDFPTNMVAGSAVNVPIEWENLDQLPVRMMLALQDGRSGAYYVQQECEINVPTGNGQFTVQIPDTAPSGDRYNWIAYMYPPGAADPWAGRLGFDDTARSDKYGVPIDFEVTVKVAGTNGAYAAYSDWGLPVGMVAYTWSGSHNATYTNEPAPEGSQSWRTLLGSSTYGGWGVFYLNRAVDLDQFNYLKFWVRSAEPLKVEVEVPKGAKKTLYMDGAHWDANRPDVWQEVTIPKSAFNLQWNLLYDVYCPFMATLILPPRYGVEFADETTAWAVGAGPEGTLSDCSSVRKTDDGGATWTAQYLPVKAGLVDQEFVDENTGWVVGSAGGLAAVFKTVDGGATWIRQTNGLASAPPVYGIFFLDSQRGWIGCNAGEVFKTLDGGETWTQVTMPAAVRYQEIQFVDETNGWMVGANRTVVHTTDGGATWTLQPVPFGTSSSGLFDLQFFDQLNGWICGAGGLMGKTTDGGATWTQVSCGTSVTLVSMDWVDSQTCHAVAYASPGVICTTTNGGSTWVKRGAGSYTYDVDFWDADTGLLVSEKGDLLRCSGIDSYGPTWVDAFPQGRRFMIDHVRWTEKP